MARVHVFPAFATSIEVDKTKRRSKWQSAVCVNNRTDVVGTVAEYERARMHSLHFDDVQVSLP